MDLPAASEGRLLGVHVWAPHCRVWILPPGGQVQRKAVSHRCLCSHFVRALEHKPGTGWPGVDGAGFVLP